MVSYHSDDAVENERSDLGIASCGFPEDWVCHYISKKLLLVDPIPELTLRLPQPFLWSEAVSLLKPTDPQTKYLQELAEADLGDGLAMQVFGPNMRNAYVGLGFGHGTLSLDAHQIFELQCAAQIAHIRYCELTTKRRRRPVDLSPRELEILNWIAKGKSNSVIAEILGISRHTVDTITRRLFDKLDVNDRTSAAIKGIGSGLLGFHP